MKGRADYSEAVRFKETMHPSQLQFRRASEGNLSLRFTWRKSEAELKPTWCLATAAGKAGEIVDGIFCF